MQRLIRFGALALMLAAGLVPAFAVGAQGLLGNSSSTDLSQGVVQVVTLNCDTSPPAQYGPAQFPGTCDDKQIIAWSGTVIDPKGLILTNAHAVYASTNPRKIGWLAIGLKSPGNDLPRFSFLAQPLVIDDNLDLAVLAPAFTLDGKPIAAGDLNLTPIPLGRAGTVKTEDQLRVLGYDLGDNGPTLRDGEATVSGILPDQTVPGLGQTGWIKTDANYDSSLAGGAGADQQGYLVAVPGLYNIDEANGQFEAGYMRPAPEAVAVLADDMKRGTGQQSQPAQPSQPTQPTQPVQPPQPSQPVQPPQPSNPFQPQAPAANTAILTGTIVSADTGSPIAGAFFLALKPGIDFAQFKADQAAKEDIFSVGISDGNGKFQVADPLTREQPFSVVVLAQGYTVAYQDGLSIPADAPAVVDLGTIRLSAQQ